MRGAVALVFFGTLLHGLAKSTEELLGEVKEFDQEHVTTWTSDELDRELGYSERALVKFFTSDCKPCEELAPVYAKGARNVKAEIDLNTKIAEVDVTNAGHLIEQFGLRELPAIKYFINGKFVTDYDGKHDADAIALFVKNKEDPAVKEIKEEEIEAFVEKVEDESFALVAHIKKKSARAKAFQKAVEDTLREWDVAEISFAAVWLPKDADPKADAKLTMHRPGIKEPDEEEVVFTGAWSEDRIVRWVQKNSYATIGQTFSRNKYAPMSMEAIASMGAVVAVINDDAAIDDEKDKKKGEDNDDVLRPQVEEALLPIAAEYPEWNFVIAELDKLEEHEQVLLGINPGEDVRIIVLGVDKKKYHLIGEDNITTTKRIRKFMKDAMANKLKQYYKSDVDPEPGEEYDEEGVLIITGNTFEKQVLDSRKDVFVKFYAPWCKHSAELEPKWAELAQKGVKESWTEKNVVIAKFDASTNECDEDVPHFPKLVFYPAVKASKKIGQKTIYSGDREVNDLVEFVKESARNLQSGDNDDDEDEDEDEDRPKKGKRKQSGKKGAEEL